MTRPTRAIAITLATMLIGQTAFADHPILRQSSPPSSEQGERTEGVESATLAESDATKLNLTMANRSDEKFLKEFSRINAAKVDTGKLAEWKAEDEKVKAFATQMVDIHSKTLAQIATIAEQSKIEVKTSPDFMQKTKSAILDISVGGSFDRAYLKATINDAEKIVDMLETEIQEGQDASIKQLAVNSLAEVQKQLLTAQEIRAAVADNKFAGRTQASNGNGGADKLAARR